jgi:hypothetical protein
MTTPKKVIRADSNEQITRVAFYDRNRVTHDTPISVIELQNAMFYRLQKTHPQWKTIGIYRDIDELGQTPGNHYEYDRLVDDCKKGMIDLVVAKSISKISRNLVDCIDKVTTLHSMDPPVELYFINENIDTRKENDLSAFVNMYALMAESEEITKVPKKPINTRYLPGTYDSKDTE